MPPLPPRLRRALIRRVQRALLSQAGTVAPLRADADALSLRIDELEAGVTELQAPLERAATRATFSPGTTVARALALHPEACTVLAGFQLDRCDSCPVRHDETLEEVARGHAIPLESLLSQLRVLQSPLSER